MAETPSSQLDEQALREEEDNLRQWIESIKYAGEGIAANTGLIVHMDYHQGIVTPDVEANKLTAAQRAEIEKWQKGLPHLDIRFHK